MFERFIRNFLNGQQIICKVRHVQTVHVACLHQCAKNVCPAAGLSSGVRTASSSSNRPSHRSKLLDEHRNNSGSKLLDAYHNNRAANLQLADLGKHAVAFALDPQGSRFIQQKLRRANSTETAQLLINEITAQVTPLSLHEHGNWVIRCVLEHCTEQQKRPVLEQLHDNVLSLVTDPYGNYVIQHVIEHGLLEDRDRIARILKGDIMKYAQDKFASNIIEKCLICGTADQKKALIDNVCGGGPKTLQNARQLMADEFGTHVIQKCFEYGTEGQKAQLVDALRGHVFTLTLQMYGSPVIQTALKSVDKASQIEIIEELTPRACVIRCIKDQYGIYVMNTIVELLEPEQLQFVVDAISNSPSDSINSLSRHEYGSWVIQRVIKHCTEQQKRPVLEQLHDNLLTLATDKYGCFVIEHVIEHGRPEDREHIVCSLLQNVPTLATDKYGCFVIEHVIEHGRPEDRERIVCSLLQNVPTLATDKYGCFVIGHMIEHGRPEDRERIARSLHENVTSMSTHEYGSRVIRCVLKHCTEQQKRPVLEQLHNNVPTLVTDPYGNYVIQHVIEHGLPEDRERIVRSLQGDILKNAHHKGICNVIDKCLVFGTMEQRNALIDQVCADNGSGSPPLLEMMKHPSANEAVLKMYDFADFAHRDKMMFAIEEHIPALIRLQTRQLEQQSLTKRDALADKRKKSNNNGLLGD